MIEEERHSGFVSNELRVILIGRDVELRVISLIVRCRSVADEVIFLDLGSNDETVELALEVDCPVLNYDDKFDSGDNGGDGKTKDDEYDCGVNVEDDINYDD